MWKNTQPYELLVLAFTTVVIATNQEATPAWIIALAVACIWVMLFRIYFLYTAACDVKKKLEDQLANDGASPWGYQHKLMLISDQELPFRPQLTKTSILYGALMLEELGETLLGLSKGIEESCNGRNSQLFNIAKQYAHQAIVCIDSSKALRKALAECTETPNEMYLSFDTAKEILDGALDMVVVTAGLTLSTGLPGMDGYVEVVSSNLSKANPVTGKIDKTPDGKWIKGVNYREPDLGKILRMYYNSPQQ